MTTSTADARHIHNPALSADIYPDDDLVQELTEALRPRLAPARQETELEHLVRTSLDALAPVHVTNYLGVLVERRLRAGGEAAPLRS